jgi:hypothetical protein
VERCGLWLDLRIFLAMALKMVGVPFPALARIFFLPRVAGVAAPRGRSPEGPEREAAPDLGPIPTAGGGQPRMAPLLLNSAGQA